MARMLPGGGLFQHIPRTGGTSVEKCLADAGFPIRRVFAWGDRSVIKKHALLHHYTSRQRRHFQFIFAFVRHPVSYYESVWKWMDRVAGEHKSLKTRRWLFHRYSWHPFTDPCRFYHHEFGVWVKRMLKNEPAWCTRLFESYVGPEGAEICHFIGRTEYLERDLNIALGTLGLKEIRVAAKHNAISRPIDWDRKLRQRVIESEIPTIRRFYDG